MAKFKKGNTFGFTAIKKSARLNIERGVYSKGIRKNLRSRKILVSSYAQSAQTPPPTPPPIQTRSKTRLSNNIRSVSANRNKFRESASCERTNAVWKREAQSNRLVHVEKNAVMWNTAFEEHRTFAPNCRGFLHWDMSKEQIRGLGCREKMICTKCSYKSKLFNLFDEVKTGRRGPPSAKQNIGLAVGLSKTPIAAASFRKICLSANMTAPAGSSIQKTSNVILSKIEQLNKDEMKMRRSKLIEKHKLMGSKTPNVLNLQADGMYNNSFYSGAGKTPFQPATQVIYSVGENITPDHDIIGLVIHNKLCCKGRHLKSKHKCSLGECFATIPFEKSIGDERTWAKEALSQLKGKSDIEVEHITTDPDSAAYLAAQDLYDENVTQTRPIHQLDTAHVSRNHRKFLKNHKELSKLIAGRTAAIRKKTLNNLAIDLAARCQAEMKKASSVYPGDIPTIKNKISYAVDAIVICYQNNHSLCKKHSFACKGGKIKNWINKSTFLGKDFSLKPVKGIAETLRTCVNYRLGPAMLEKTKFNFNTQKVEAFNRALRSSLPKNVTFSRNVSGRAHSVCHSVNQGTGDSIRNVKKQLGCAISANSKVDKALKQLQSKEKLLRSYKKTKKNIKARAKKRKNLYTLYEKHQEELKYKKDILLPPRLNPKIGEHSYSGESKRKRVKVRK